MYVRKDNTMQIFISIICSLLIGFSFGLNFKKNKRKKALKKNRKKEKTFTESVKLLDMINDDQSNRHTIH
ncbi:MAG: hypothetical protein RR623_06730 [Bacilli bacterium]